MEKAPFSTSWTGAAPALAAWARLRTRPALRRRLDADDLLQEVCARAYGAYEGYDPARGPFQAWAFGIAGRVLKEALVQLGRAPEAVVDRSGTAFLDRVPDEATTVSRRLARDEALASFCAWVDTWEGEERDLLVLRGLEGRSHADVAAHLGLGEEAVKKRWQRLSARVRERGVPLDLP